MEAVKKSVRVARGGVTRVWESRNTKEEREASRPSDFLRVPRDQRRDPARDLADRPDLRRNGRLGRHGGRLAHRRVHERLGERRLAPALLVRVLPHRRRGGRRRSALRGRRDERHRALRRDDGLGRGVHHHRAEGATAWDAPVLDSDERPRGDEGRVDLRRGGSHGGRADLERLGHERERWRGLGEVALTCARVSAAEQWEEDEHDPPGCRSSRPRGLRRTRRRRRVLHGRF